MSRYRICDVFIFHQHQQQVAAAVERAKQVTIQELNAVIGVSSGIHFSGLSHFKLFLPVMVLPTERLSMPDRFESNKNKHQKKATKESNGRNKLKPKSCRT